MTSLTSRMPTKSTPVVRSLSFGGFGIYRDNLRAFVFGGDRLLPPFFDLEEFVFPQFLYPQNAQLIQPLDVFSATYHPKFSYALEYNLNVQRELAQGMILSAGYFGARGNHLTREAEQNPFEPASGHRYNPILPSPLLTDLTDGQSFYNSFEVSVSKRPARDRAQLRRVAPALLWQCRCTRTKAHPQRPALYRHRSNAAAIWLVDQRGRMARYA